MVICRDMGDLAFGSHIGRHLELRKMLKDARWAPGRLLIYTSQLSNNTKTKTETKTKIVVNKIDIVNTRLYIRLYCHGMQHRMSVCERVSVCKRE